MNTQKTAIIYGSTTGTTAEIARRLADKLGIDQKNILDVSEIAPSVLADYDNIIAASSTWGSGDLQDDWYDFADGVKALDLKGKKVALLGVGDENMSDTFCSAIGTLYDVFKSAGAEIVGQYDITAPYHFSHTSAEVDGVIVGLLIDETNHPEATDERLDKWAEILKKEF